MPETYRVRITPRALADLESIFRSITTDSPQNAATMIGKILDDIDGLEIFPHRYGVPRLGAVSGREIRSMPVRPYLVRYRIDEARKSVHILQVRHGSRRDA
jgi:plasmid stabilization system protein ParE